MPHWAETANFLQKLVLRLLCSDMKIFHATGLLRYQGLQENHKRPTKVMKVKTKARDLSIPKFEKKSYLWGPLVSLVYSFSYFQVTRSLRPKRPPQLLKTLTYTQGFLQVKNYSCIIQRHFLSYLLLKIEQTNEKQTF